MELLENPTSNYIERQDKLKQIRSYSVLLDSKFKIPGTNFTFGIDPILSFIPFLGSFSGLITGFVLIWMGRKKGAEGLVLLKMTGNIFIDFLVGLVPILGNVSDFFIKGNGRNVKLLEEHFLEDKHKGSGLWLLLVIIIGIIAGFIISIWAAIYIVKELDILLENIFKSIS